MRRALITILAFFSSVACSKAPPLPIQEVQVRIARDGSCTADGAKIVCNKIGFEMVRKYPGKRVSIVLGVDPDAEYLVLAGVLQSIREAKITMTSLTPSD